MKVEILGVVQPVGAVGCDARGDKTPSLKRDAEVSIYLISKLHQSFPPDIEAAEIRLVISGIYGFSTSRGNRSLLQLYWSKCFRLRYAPDCLTPNQASSY